MIAELGTAEFYVGLVRIIGIDLVLAGDNAVVIALACRSLPPEQRRWGVALGAGVAVLMRIVFAFFVTFVMAVPYLKLVGGLLLLWIGYKLMMPQNEDVHVSASAHLWGAVRTIAIADAVMSLDNVIAVAGAAQGSLLLLSLGLVISIPLVVYGAQLLVKLIERYPVIIAMGAALIGYVAGEVIITDNALLPWVDAHAHWLHYVAPMAGAVAVVLVGQMVAPRPAPAAASTAEAVAAPLGAFGARALLLMIARVLVIRAPFIVAFVAGAFGYTGANVIVHEPVLADWAGADADWVRAVGPIAAAALGVIAVEIATRLRRR
ncbi:MAG: TerC family protein [Alphaproteobacteria bacterium]|nr:TerC family protein [Alphaproteobacteria bacterium]